jgi:hypothetical protein
LSSNNRNRESKPLTFGRWLFGAIVASVAAASVAVGYINDKHKTAIAHHAAVTHTSVTSNMIGAWVVLFVIFFAVAAATGILVAPFGRGKDKGSQRTAGGWSVSR